MRNRSKIIEVVFLLSAQAEYETEDERTQTAQKR